ncbi:hypothetical protein LCGC14_0676670 [marine sediment metagenome]|uniref:Uncharacterized protein n=1 Tax=marine sediment metagenome TaxID=412755 RepID=A0A0F9TXB3_9ZZZZ
MIEIQPNPYTGGKRLVVVGTLGNPETVTQRHLDMLDGDARSSHLERFIADGLDLTGFDLRDVTTLDGTIANSNLYGAASTYWYSRGCTFPGTDIPQDASSLHHDFALALIRTYLAEHPTLIRKMRDALQSIDTNISDYAGSWDDSIEALIRVLGLNEAEVIDILTKAFSRHPRMMTRLGKVMTGRTWKPEKYQFPWPVWRDAARVRAQLTNPNDRLEAQLLLDGDLDLVAPRHYVFQWEPDPYLFTVDNPRIWGWWEKSKA